MWCCCWYVQRQQLLKKSVVSCICVFECRNVVRTRVSRECRWVVSCWSRCSALHAIHCLLRRWIHRLICCPPFHMPCTTIVLHGRQNCFLLCYLRACSADGNILNDLKTFLGWCEEDLIEISQIVMHELWHLMVARFVHDITCDTEQQILGFLC